MTTKTNSKSDASRSGGSTATRYTVGSYLIDRLKELGIRHIFGVPGDYGFPFMDQIEADPDIAWVGTCNELNAAFAAAAYACINGIAALTGSVGVVDLGAASGIAGAYDDQLPVIFISCHPSTQEMTRGTFTHHSLRGNWDRYPRIYEEMTATQALLTEHNACQEIDRALLACWAEKSPVYIRLPRDVSELPVQRPAAKLALPEPTSDPAQLDEFLDRFLPLLTAAKNPVMLVDYPVARYQLTELVQDLAAKLGIPFAATSIAKTAFLDETHPMYLGMYRVGMGSTVEQKVESSDLLIRLCIQYDELNAGDASSELQDPHVVDLHPRSASIAASHYPQVALRDVLTRLGTQPSGRKPASRPAPPHITVAPFEPRPATAITQDRLWQALSNFVREDDVLVLEWGTCQALAQITFPVRSRTVMQGSWSAIGYSTPALLGAHLADRRRRHIHVVGDGAFQETAQELSTIIRQGLAPIILLLNNGVYLVENITHVPPKEIRYNVLQNWNYHQLPAVFAGTQNPLGLRVTTEEELHTAFTAATEAQREGRCALLEVVLDPRDTAPLMFELVDASRSALLGRRSQRNT